MNLDNDYSIRIIETTEEIGSIRDFWIKHQHHVYSDFDYYLFSSKNDPEFLRPLITVLYKNDEPMCLIVGRIARRTLNWALGLIKLGKSQTICLEIGYHGFLGEFSVHTTQRMIEFLANHLKKIGVNFIYFDRINTESVIFKSIQKSSRFLNRDYLVLRYKNYRLQLLDSFEDFYQTKSRSTKKMINSYRNRLKNKFGDDVQIKSYYLEDQVDEALENINHVALKSYLQKIGQGFTKSEAMRQKWLFLAKRNIFRAHIMYINDHPCAFWVGYLYKGIYFLIYTGYDPDYHYYHVGTLVLMHIIEQYSRDKSCRTIDYGLGEELYKKIFGNQINNVANFMLFSPTLKGQFIRMSLLVTVGTTELAKKILTKINLMTWAKKISRKIRQHT